MHRRECRSAAFLYFRTSPASGCSLAGGAKLYISGHISKKMQQYSQVKNKPAELQAVFSYPIAYFFKHFL
jgi:hypothetical protein